MPSAYGIGCLVGLVRHGVLGSTGTICERIAGVLGLAFVGLLAGTGGSLFDCVSNVVGGVPEVSSQ